MRKTKYETLNNPAGYEILPLFGIREYSDFNIGMVERTRVCFVVFDFSILQTMRLARMQSFSDIMRLKFTFQKYPINTWSMEVV